MKPRVTAQSVIAAARAVSKAREKISVQGMASDSVWDAIERKENSLLRAVEKLAGLKRGTLGWRDSS